MIIICSQIKVVNVFLFFFYALISAYIIDSLVDNYDKFKPSEHYGFIHLLRLFVRFGHMLA